MDVYYIPLAPGQFEPYFEHEDVSEPEDVTEPRGIFGRLAARFSAMVREAEEARHEKRHEPAGTWAARLQRRLMGWVAERVAEQRLLWQLRRAGHATLHVPDDLAPEEGLRRFRDGLGKDADRHLRLLAVHTVGLLLSAPFALVPGPNVFGYLFTFTVVGHFLSFRGARRGLSTVQWTVAPNAALRQLAQATATPPPERYQLIHEAAEQLHLRHLTRFVERMASRVA